MHSSHTGLSLSCGCFFLYIVLRGTVCCHIASGRIQRFYGGHVILMVSNIRPEINRRQLGSEPRRSTTVKVILQSRLQPHIPVQLTLMQSFAKFLQVTLVRPNLVVICIIATPSVLWCTLVLRLSSHANSCL